MPFRTRQNAPQFAPPTVTDYVLSRTLVDPDVKPSVDAYMKEVTRTPEAARQFLQKASTRRN